MALPALYQSELHPAALTLDERPFVEGTVTEAELQGLMDDFRAPPVVTALRVVLPQGCGFAARLQQMGFVMTRVTRLLTFDLTTPALPLQADMPKGLRPRWVRPAASVDWDAWCAAHWAYYARVHTANPPRDPGLVGRKEVFLGDDLVDAFWGRSAEGAICAVASLRRGQELGWIGTPDAADAALVPGVLSMALSRAVARGWTRAVLEVDDDDPALWAAVATVEVAAEERFLTWTWDRPPG